MLRAAIRHWAAEGIRRLPAEDELAQQLNVSRVTVRSGLHSLQQEGLISRVHGSGTYINSLVLQVPANISRNQPFLEVLEGMGYEADSTVVEIAVEETPPPENSFTDWEGVRACYVVKRIFYASGQPSVFCVDYVPSTDTSKLAVPEDGESSVFAFIEHQLAVSVKYSIAEIVPVVATGEQATVLNLAEGTPQVLLQHIHVDHNDVPVGLTRAYINDELLRFSVIRAHNEASG